MHENLTEIEFKILTIFSRLRVNIDQSIISSHLHNDPTVFKVNQNALAQSLANFKFAGLISQFPIASNQQQSYVLSDKGKAFYETWRESRDKQREEKELIFKKLKYDVTNSYRIYKSYQLTQVITWVSFGIAVCLGLLKLAEAIKIWPYHK